MYKKMKGFSAGLVALVMAMSISTVNFAQESTKETKTHWAFEKMQRWSDRGIIKGSDSDGLRADDNITRAEVATIINKVFGFTSKAASQFGDVKKGDWYADELLKARAAGYFKGYTGNFSKAQAKITREDTAVIISNVFCLVTEDDNNLSNSFKDSGTISKYALAAVNKLSSDEVIKGYSDGRFQPKANITRAEFITIIDNLTKMLCNSPGTYGPENVQGNVIVNQASVELKDMNIDGNLYMTAGAEDGTANLNNVTVTEMTYISGDNNNINITNSKLNIVVVNSKDAGANLALNKTSSIKKIKVYSPLKIQIDESSKALLDINSDGVVVNGQTIKKGFAIVESGIVKQSISENSNEVPAVAPSIASTATASITSAVTPVITSTPTNKSNSGSSGSKGSSGSSSNSGNSGNSGHNGTTTTKPTTPSTATTIPTATATATPTPTTTELKLESATADNLAEIVLKFNKPIENESKAQDAANYLLKDEFGYSGKNFLNAELSPDKMTVTLLLANIISQQSSVDLRIKSDIGLTKDTDVTIDIINDITAPKVVNVTAMGNRRVKLTFSEPLKNAKNYVNYIIDGKNVGCRTYTFSNSKMVIVGFNTPLSQGSHKLVLSNELSDYASLKIEENETEFTVNEDNIAPNGIIESATQTKVVIKFNEEVEDILHENVITDTEAKINYIDLADDLKTLTILFRLDRALPTTGGNITINNLSDYFGNTVNFTINVSPAIDVIRPEFIAYKIAKNQKQIILEFSEDVYMRGVYKLTDRDNTSIDVLYNYDYDKVTYEDAKNKIVLTRTNGLAFNSEKYLLEITEVKDLTPIANEIVKTSVTIDVCDQILPTVDNVLTYPDENKINIEFIEKVDKTIAESRINYRYVLNDRIIYNLSSNTTITLLPDGKTVSIEFPLYDEGVDNANKVDVNNFLAVQVESVTDLAGNKMKPILITKLRQDESYPQFKESPSFSKIFIDGYYNNKIYVAYDEKVDENTAVSTSSYLYALSQGIYKILPSDSKLTLLSDGKTVCIEFFKNDLDVNSIDVFQVDSVKNLNGTKIPTHAITIFNDIDSPRVQSVKVTDKNTIVVKISGAINDKTLCPDDFLIQSNSTTIEAWDAEYDQDKQEIKLTVNADIEADGTYEGEKLILLDKTSDMETQNIFGKELYMQSNEIVVADEFAPRIIDSVASYVYGDKSTEIFIELSENLELTNGEELLIDYTDQFTVTVGESSLAKSITYYDADVFDNASTDVDETCARFKLVIAGDYSDMDTTVIFTSNDTLRITDKVGNALESFHVIAKAIK